MKLQLMPNAVKEADDYFTKRVRSSRTSLRVAELIYGFETPYTGS